MKPLESINFEAYVSEFIGTFFLVLTIGINVLQQTALAPISIGLTLACMIFATGKVSGGHFNPAVTVGVLLCGPRLPLIDCCLYIVSQLLGALVAAGTYKAILGATFTFQPGGSYNVVDVALVEVLFSATLIFVFLGVCAADRDNPRAGNQFGGLAVGFTVMASAFAIGSVSGCSLNPAVTFGVMMSNYMHVGSGMRYFGLYLLCPFLGALLGAALFYLLRGSVRNMKANVEKVSTPPPEPYSPPPPEPAPPPPTPAPRPAEHREPIKAAVQRLGQDRDFESPPNMKESTRQEGDRHSAYSDRSRHSAPGSPGHRSSGNSPTYKGRRRTDTDEEV